MEIYIGLTSLSLSVYETAFMFICFSLLFHLNLFIYLFIYSFIAAQEVQHNNHLSQNVIYSNGATKNGGFDPGVWICLLFFIYFFSSILPCFYTDCLCT